MESYELALDSLHEDVDRQGEAPHEGDRRVAPHQGEDVSTDRVFCFVPCRARPCLLAAIWSILGAILDPCQSQWMCPNRSICKQKILIESVWA